jgi:hypothetical protein
LRDEQQLRLTNWIVSSDGAGLDRLSVRLPRVALGSNDREQSAAKLREPRAPKLPLPPPLHTSYRGPDGADRCLSALREMNETRAPVGGVAAQFEVTLSL